MAFVAVATSVGTAVGLGGLAATIGGGALIGAGVGGLYSAITGDGNILNSMLTGGLIGGAAGGIGGAIAPQTAGIASAPSTALAPTSNVVTGTAATSPIVPAQVIAENQAIMQGAINPATGLPYAETSLAGSSAISQAAADAATKTGTGLTGNQMLGYGLAGTTALSLLGSRQKGAGAGTMPDPGSIRPFEYTSTPVPPTGDYPSPYATASYEESGTPIIDSRERNYFNQSFAPMQPYSAKIGTPNPNIPLPSSSPVNAADGGIMRNYDAELGGDYSAMGMDQGNMQKGLFGMGYAAGGSVKKYALGGLTLIENLIRQAEQGQMPQYQFDQSTQRYSMANQPAMATPSLGGYRFDPTANRYEQNAQPMAAGGTTGLGGYSDGGRMLKGPGDGMSDSIPGVIGSKQPARLADGEFVVPADVVSHLGNGSTDAGAKRLYSMMDKVRKARTGTKKQGKQIKAEKFIPA